MTEVTRTTRIAKKELISQSKIKMLSLFAAPPVLQAIEVGAEAGGGARSEASTRSGAPNGGLRGTGTDVTTETAAEGAIQGGRCMEKAHKNIINWCV